VNVLRGYNSEEWAAVQAELEGKLAHLGREEGQILMPVLNEYLDLFCNDVEGVLPCTTTGFHEIRIGAPCLSRSIPTVHRMRCVMG
jgi:hypothetical protein